MNEGQGGKKGYLVFVVFHLFFYTLRQNIYIWVNLLA